jgi:hypothetical protein
MTFVEAGTVAGVVVSAARDRPVHVNDATARTRRHALTVASR